MTPQVCLERDTAAQEYQGLVRVAGMIARHPDYPGKRVVVEECAEDIVERCHELLAILAADRLRAEDARLLIEPPRPTRIEVRPSSAAVRPGESVTFTATC